MKIFETEEYFGKYEFTQPYQLALSDCESVDIAELIHLGGGSVNDFLQVRLGYPEMPGSRVLRKEPQLYKDLLNLKSYTSMCAPQTLENLGLMTIRAAPQLIEKNLKIVKENLRTAEPFFEKWREHLKWLKPLAGSVSVIKVEEPSAEAFCHKMASQFGLVLLPIKYMGYQDQYIRMGFGRLNFKSNIDILDKALNSIYR